MGNPEGTSADTAAPQVVIEPRRGWLGVNWKELWQHRELLYFLTWRDVKLRYKQTVLGVLWAVLQPLVKMVVLTIVFKGIAGLDSEGYPYPVFVFAGLLPWQFFAESLKRSSDSVVNSAHLVGKVYFPRLIIPIASVGATLVDFALSFIILVGIMVYYRVAPSAAILMVVPLALLTAVAALGVGTVLSALNVAYRDFRYVVPFMVEVWFFATPVVWSLKELEGKFGAGWRLAAALNPMCGIAEAYKSALLPGRPLDWPVLGVSAAVVVSLLVVGLHFFRRFERQFADII